MRWAAAALGISLCVLSFTRCGGTADRDVQPVVLGLVERLKPERGEVFNFSGLRTDRTGVHASWEIETGMGWTDYSVWITPRVPPEFKAGEPTDGSSLAFRKSTTGDLYVLRITPVGASAPSRVRATFDGFPN